MELKIKRVYDTPDKKDGYRILVDRIWPRGMKKENAKLNLWLKEIAPSTELRKWFGHDPKKWDEFQSRYRKELDENTDAVNQIKKQLSEGKVTLVYGAKDEAHNQAVVLEKYLSENT